MAGQIKRVSLRKNKLYSLRTTGGLIGGEQLECSVVVPIPGKGLRQDLDRHLAVQLGVSGTVHLSHATFTDLCDDLVMGDGRVDHGWECNRLSCCCQPQAGFKPESL